MGHACRFELGLQHADIFAYFSHARLSPPPPAWTAACHAAGVRALGSLVTEWEDGERANALLNAALGQACAAYAQWHGFDGWLVNVEAGALDCSPSAPLAGSAGAAAAQAQLQNLYVWRRALQADEAGAACSSPPVFDKKRPLCNSADSVVKPVGNTGTGEQKGMGYGNALDKCGV
jgi:hypothetical protein